MFSRTLILSVLSVLLSLSCGSDSGQQRRQNQDNQHAIAIGEVDEINTLNIEEAGIEGLGAKDDIKDGVVAFKDIEAKPEQPIFEYKEPEGKETAFSKPVMVSGANLTSFQLTSVDLQSICQTQTYQPTMPSYGDLPADMVADYVVCFKIVTIANGQVEYKPSPIFAVKPVNPTPVTSNQTFALTEESCLEEEGKIWNNKDSKCDNLAPEPYEHVGIQMSDVELSMNGKSTDYAEPGNKTKLKNVKVGDSIQIDFKWAVPQAQTYCPGCITFIAFGFIYKESDGKQTIYKVGCTNHISRATVHNGKHSAFFSVPNKKGIYYFKQFKAGFEYNCADFTIDANDSNIGYLLVE